MRIPLLLLSAVLALPAADDGAALAALHQAFAGNDAQAKRAAVRALASKTAGTDEQVLPLLVARVEDRQVGELVIQALRARTGLSTPVGNEGSAEQPGRKAAHWQAWLTKWQEKKKAEKDLEALKDKEKEKGKDQPSPDAPVPAAGADSSDSQARTPPPPPDDLGRLDRIVFRNGGSLIAFVMSKRLDADGNLLSVRVVHPEGGGEEILQAALIARIEEDVR